MYISDFYSPAYSFLPAWSWNHWLRGGAAMENEKYKTSRDGFKWSIQYSYILQCFLNQMHIPIEL